MTSKSVSPLRWGILSTGRIAGVFAKALSASRGGRLVAVGSRSAEGAARFAKEHRIAAAHAHASYGALLADPDVEAVYIATPHPGHVEWAEKAAGAGKWSLTADDTLTIGRPSVCPAENPNGYAGCAFGALNLCYR